jgi:hypothetical protein
VYGGVPEGEWHTLLWQGADGIAIAIQPVMLDDPPEVPDDLSGLG